MPIGGSNRYPSLQSIADLFRASVNDDFIGADGIPGEGLINYNTAPHMLTFMNSAIRDVYSDLRNVGDPELILDNYLLLGIPPLASPNPAVQVSIADIGYFDGFQFNSQWALPSNCQRVLKLWERWSGSENVFVPMTPVAGGLGGVYQVQRMGTWEMRQNAIWMPGCLVAVDLRIRCTITFPDFLNPTAIDFTTAYVPVLDCQNAIVAKMVVLYAKRFAPEQYQMAVTEDARMIDKLKLEVVRQQQMTDYQRTAYGEEATVSFPAAWTQL